MEDPALDERSLGDVSDMITHAKLIESDLLPLSQVVSFTDELMGDDIKLLEVSKDIANSLTSGDILTIRGHEDENAVICSRDKTYDIKEAETSNSLMLVPQIVLPGAIAKTGNRTLSFSSVTGIFHKYLELIEIRPRLRKLKDLLMKTPYNEDARREEIKGLTYSEILDSVQASEEEILAGLEQFECVEVEGLWYVLDQDYQMMVLSRILKFFDENSWSLNLVHKKETVTTLSSLVHPEVVSRVFDFYTLPVDGGNCDDFSLNQEKVSRFFGDFLLAANSGYVLSEFLEMWQKAVPDGISTDLNHLQGLVLLEEDKSPAVIKRFAEDSLPLTIGERLNVLFSAREKWKLEEISPFVSPLTTNKLNVNALLTKFARPVNICGVKYFCAKHGK